MDVLLLMQQSGVLHNESLLTPGSNIKDAKASVD